MTRSRVRPGRPYLAGAPLLMAHRGGAKLAPENTMEAFRSAVERWRADVLEMDVRLTSDGRVVVIHDATVDRTTDGQGAVSDHTWKEIGELDAGYNFVDLEGRRSFRGQGVRVPSIEEVLEAFPAMRLNIESKTAEAAAPLVRAIRAADATHRVLVAAEHEPTRAGAVGYEGPWGASRGHVIPFWLVHRFPLVRSMYRPAVDAFQVPEVQGPLRVVSRRFVEAAHAQNIPVHVWTVDDPNDMRRLLEWGVDGIQTDRPDLLSAVLEEEWGRPSPAAAEA